MCHFIIKTPPVTEQSVILFWASWWLIYSSFHPSIHSSIQAKERNPATSFPLKRGLHARSIFSVVLQFSLVAQSWLTFVTPWTAACQVFLSIAISQSLLRLMSVESVMPSNHLITHLLSGDE